MLHVYHPNLPDYVGLYALAISRGASHVSERLGEHGRLVQVN